MLADPVANTTVRVSAEVRCGRHRFPRRPLCHRRRGGRGRRRRGPGRRGCRWWWRRRPSACRARPLISTMASRCSATVRTPASPRRRAAKLGLRPLAESNAPESTSQCPWKSASDAPAPEDRTEAARMAMKPTSRHPDHQGGRGPGSAGRVSHGVSVGRITPAVPRSLAIGAPITAATGGPRRGQGPDTARNKATAPMPRSTFIVRKVDQLRPSVPRRAPWTRHRRGSGASKPRSDPVPPPAAQRSAAPSTPGEQA